ncbi:hypothetical protein P885DRAFT_44524 [Corynascus similis CBS 632.67]
MDYIRESSQPATIDLVRADLAETWSIDGSDQGSPKRPPPISGISDMLDLEYISTPGCRPSKAQKKDPLPDLLNSILEFTPSRKGREPIGTPKSTKSCLVTRPELDSRIAHPASNTSKRKRPDQSATADEIPINSSISKSRRQYQRDGQLAPLSPVKKRAKKTSKQVKALSASVSPPHTRTRTKEKQDVDDLFELSDITDTELESKPKKPQAMNLSPQHPRPSNRSKIRNKDKAKESPNIQRSARTRAPEERAGGFSQDENAGTESKHSESEGLADQSAKLDTTRYRHDEENVALSKLMSDYVPTPGKDDTLNEYLSAKPLEQPAIPPSTKETMREEVRNCNPQFSGACDAIIVSSESPNTRDAAAGSTSPLFMEPSPEDIIATVVSDAPLSGDTRSSRNQGSPTSDGMDHSHPSFTSQPPAQTRALGRASEVAQRHTEHSFPSHIKDAFLSDEQPVTPKLFLPQKTRSCSPNNPIPENIWKRAVEDDSPPAILHRIMTLLHRSLKPREEVVRDIAVDYRENATRLLDNLVARHNQERAEATSALRKAFRATFSIYSSAAQEMVAFVNSLRDVDVNQTAEPTTRPALADKLDAVVRLCQTKLNDYTQNAPAWNDGASDSSDNLDSFAKIYRHRLTESIRKHQDTILETSDKISLQVIEFIQQCLVAGEPKEGGRIEARKPGRSARDADEALEVLLDRIIGTLQETNDDAVFNQAARESRIPINSENFDLEFLG